jgi:7-cyano-7-deazaguanine reductase
MLQKNKKSNKLSVSSKVKKSSPKEVDAKVGQVAEGKKFKFDSIHKIRTNELIVFEFDSPHQLIEITAPEFSAVCPFSGLPDIATVKISYYPMKGLALELKALKYYFMSFRSVGIYQEAVTARMYRDLKKILGHDKITVTTIYNTRGGIDVTCTEGGKLEFSI